MNPAAVLAGRPPLEAVVAHYERMLTRIRDALDVELGPFGWRQFRPPRPSSCGQEFPYELGGRSLQLATWGFDAPVPDGDWPLARAVVAGVAGGYGFAPAGLHVDGPGRHVAGGVDRVLGAFYELGTQHSTTIRVGTGCHLPAALLG